MTMQYVAVVLVGCFVCACALVLDGTNDDMLQTIVRLQNELTGVKDELREIREMQQACGGCDGETGLTSIGHRDPIPAFLARLTRHLENCSTDDPVVFDKTMVNVGSAYDNRHGTFRAPVNGSYHFAVTLSDRPSTGYHVKLVRNFPNNELGYLFLGTEIEFQIRSTSVVVHLNAGDDVWVACVGPGFSKISGGNSGLQHDYHSHFSGFLIAAD